MQTMLYDATRYRRWLIAAASTALLVGCGGPYAWNEYLDPGYQSATASGIISPSTAPSVVSGTVGGVSTDELRVAVADTVETPNVAGASASMAPQQGSSTAADPATRTVWVFSSAPAQESAGTEVRVVATYYRDDAILSVAEGNGVITGGNDPRLRQLIAYVASALVPQVRHSGNGHS
jgi:hypothetical protein